MVSETATVEDPAYAEYVGALQAEVQALGPDVVKSVGSYLTEDGPVSESGRAVLLPVLMTETDEDALADDAKLLDEAVTSVERPEGFETHVAGPATLFNQFNEIIEEDIAKGEGIGSIVALIVLLVVLGSVVAGLIPLVLAAFSIAIAMGATALAGQVVDFSFFVQNMITMIGLAVGIDYSLFIVARYREERLHGREKLEAIGRAGAHGQPRRVLQRDDGGPRVARAADRPEHDLPESGGRRDLRRPGRRGRLDDAAARDPRAAGRPRSTRSASGRTPVVSRRGRGSGTASPAW